MLKIKALLILFSIRIFTILLHPQQSTGLDCQKIARLCLSGPNTVTVTGDLLLSWGKMIIQLKTVDHFDVADLGAK